MALVRNFFSGGTIARRKASAVETTQREAKEQALLQYSDVRRPQITKDDIRLLVFTECSTRLLFDTKSVIPVESAVGEVGRLSKCGKYYFLRHCPDTAGLGQLIFGSVPIPAKSEALKVHRLKNAVMLTRVFPVAKNPDINRSHKLVESLSSDSESHNYWSLRSNDPFYGSPQSPKIKRTSISCPDPPEKFARLRHDSYHSGGASPQSCDDVPMFSPGRLSRSRRLNMSRKGSICDEGLQHSASRSRLSSCCSSFADNDGVKQVGIAVLVPERLREFTFTHIPIIETEIFKLEAQVTKAMLSKTYFLSLISEGWNTFCQLFCLLYNAPRILTPVWISLSNTGLQEMIAQKFCSTLAELVVNSDTKSSKYFISTTLSCVLMNHVSWVASVNSPATCSNASDLLIGKNLPDKDLKPPYNCLLAQYLEICGSIGVGNRHAKTVIVGDDVLLITKLIYVLSYFIRCSSVAYDENSVKTTAKTEPVPICEPLSVDVSFDQMRLREESRRIDTQQSRLVHFEDEETPDNRLTLSYNNVEVVENNSDKLSSSECGISAAVKLARPTEEYNLGSSLLAGVCSAFSEYFVLSGIDKSQVKMADVTSAIIDHVRLSDEENLGLLTTRTSSPHSSTDSASNTASANDLLHYGVESGGSKAIPTHASVFIVTDANDCSVKVFASEGGNVSCSEVTSPSEVIVSMLEQFVDLYKLGCATAFLISFLEDNLSAILSKSISLVELLYDEDRQNELCAYGETLDQSTASRVIGCDCSDLRMVVNVAAVYHPRILSALK